MMNRVIGSGLRRKLRAFTAEASKRPTLRHDYLTPQQILEDPSLQALLQKSQLTPSTQISDPKVKLSILAHLSEKCNVPVASNAFLEMSTVDGIADWYSAQLKPCSARPHVRNLIRHTLGSGEKAEEIDDRIDLDRDAVQQELESRIPSNVVFDEKTFLKVDTGFGRVQARMRPQLNRR